MTFSPEAISLLTEGLRTFQLELADAEKAVAKARARMTEWSALIQLAQEHSYAPAAAVTEWDSSLEEDRDPAAWCECGAPAQRGMVHAITQCVPGFPAPADRERGNTDWCLCGQPQMLGMVHSLTRCYEGELDLTPALPQPGDRLILPTGPVPAPNMGAWFGSGRPPYTEQGATTP